MKWKMLYIFQCLVSFVLCLEPPTAVRNVSKRALFLCWVNLNNCQYQHTARTLTVIHSLLFLSNQRRFRKRQAEWYWGSFVFHKMEPKGQNLRAAVSVYHKSTGINRELLLRIIDGPLKVTSVWAIWACCLACPACLSDLHLTALAKYIQ